MERIPLSSPPDMLYLFAIICPPVAVLLCGKPLQAFVNLLLTVCLWVPGVLHALFMVNSHLADRRTDRVIREMKQHQLNSVLRKL